MPTEATTEGTTKATTKATTVRKGAIHRATAPAAENVTSGKLVLQDFERQVGLTEFEPATT
jgi:hypothetical protein